MEHQVSCDPLSKLVTTQLQDDEWESMMNSVGQTKFRYFI